MLIKTMYNKINKFLIKYYLKKVIIKTIQIKIYLYNSANKFLNIIKYREMFPF